MKRRKTPDLPDGMDHILKMRGLWYVTVAVQCPVVNSCNCIDEDKWLWPASFRKGVVLLIVFHELSEKEYELVLS